jgi:hypothetical protein
LTLLLPKELGLHYMNDGEFWMEFFFDFCREFEVNIFVFFPFIGKMDRMKNTSEFQSAVLYID